MGSPFSCQAFNEAMLIVATQCRPRLLFPFCEIGFVAGSSPKGVATFRSDLHPGVRLNYVLADPSFTHSDWIRNNADVFGRFDRPPGVILS
jgi:hypothetical protein